MEIEGSDLDPGAWEGCLGFQVGDEWVDVVDGGWTVSSCPLSPARPVEGRPGPTQPP